MPKQHTDKISFKLSVLLIAGVLAANSLISASVAYADNILCVDFADCMGNGYTTHGYDKKYTSSYWRAIAGHNCTNYVGYMLTQNGDSGLNVRMGDGADWDDSTNSLDLGDINDTPSIGSIAQWNSGNHVAYVESAGSNWIIVSEDNYANGPFQWRLITQSGDWPDNFLHIQDVMPTTAMTSQITSNGYQHVYFGTQDGRIREAWWGGGNPVSTSYISDANSPITAITSQFIGSAQHVYYGTHSGKIYEAWWGGGNPVDVNFIADLGSPVLSISSQVSSNGYQHVYSGTQDGKVRESWWGGGNPVSTGTLSSVGSPVLSMTSQITSNGYQHVYFGTQDGRIREAWWGGGNPVKTSSVAGLNAPVLSLSSQITGSIQHVYSGTQDGKVRESWWGGGNPVSTGTLASF